MHSKFLKIFIPAANVFIAGVEYVVISIGIKMRNISNSLNGRNKWRFHSLVIIILPVEPSEPAVGSTGLCASFEVSKTPLYLVRPCKASP